LTLSVLFRVNCPRCAGQLTAEVVSVSSTQGRPPLGYTVKCENCYITAGGYTFGPKPLKDGLELKKLFDKAFGDGMVTDEQVDDFINSFNGADRYTLNTLHRDDIKAALNAVWNGAAS